MNAGTVCPTNILLPRDSPCLRLAKELSEKTSLRAAHSISAANREAAANSIY